MMNRLWRLVSVCLIVALCWHPSGHVDCKEQLPEAQTLPTVLDASQEEEPGEESHLKVKEEWVFQALSEDGLLTEGDPAEEELVTQGWVEEQEHVQEEEELVAEPEPEPLIEPEQPPPEPEQPPPEPSVTQDQQPTPTPDLSPPPSPPAPAAEDSSSTPSSEDSTFNSVPEDATADIPVSDPSNTDLAAECEAGETNPYDSPHASLPAVLENTSNAHSGGTKPHVDPLVTQGANASRMLKEQGLSSHVATETDPSVPNKDPEDIPTFDEWKKKMMEVEKEKIQSTHTSSNGGSHPGKKVQKNFNNYASVECGAKILGSNPEAKSTSAILMENMDMYMLNPCSNKIWFIIELCEPIQVKQLDIANFELFSSTPKDFLVSISDRYPTNKWLKLGTFHGRDERTVQSFPLDEHLYAKYVKMFTKYIKVELVSHFGSEHFCPLSLIRVFGTSMVEEYEEIADPTERSEDQEDDFDNPAGYVPADDKSSNNLIGSAKDVILNMVTNIAVNVLGGGPEMEGNFSTQELNMTETSTSSQLDPTTTTLTPAPDTVEVDQPDIQVDLDVTITEAPTPDSPIPETPSTEQDQIVTPIQEKDDDSVQSTITLLDGEEEEVDERGREEHYNPDIRQQESLDYCELSSSSSSSSLSCTCSASLQEYLHRQCSVMLTTQRKHNIQERVPEVFLPQVDNPLFPPVSQTPQQPHPQGDQPKEREPTPAQEASPMEAPQLPQDHTEALGEPSSELPQLEPSQTSSLPSSTDSPTTRPTPAVEPSQASTKDLPKQRHPDAEKSHEVHAEEEEEEEKKKKEEQQQPTLTFTAAATAPTSTRTDSSATVDQSWGAPTEEKPSLEVDLPEQDAPIHTKDVAGPPYPLLPAPNSPTEQAVPRPEPESSSSVSEESHSAAGAGVTDPLDSHAVSTEIKGEELVEDILFTSSNSNGQPPRPTSSSPSPTHSEFYAELHNTTEPVNGNGNQVHGSSQKESVFMRLNNRIKALEMNMSLSGRYLEQLSQRYRKQMEEMQRAFNTTIIKLQNTSRIAEEQDQRQTESIQALQGQLENITQLVLKLSVRVSQLQSEVSDRQSYLLLCLVLCLFLGLLLCIHYCRMSAMPPSTDPEPPIPKSYSYYSPERRCSYDDTGLKRRASYPLLHSDSFQLPTTEGPELPHTVEPQRFSAANRKKKRSKMKPIEKVETLKSTAPLLANGVPVCNGAPHSIDTTPPRGGLSHPTFKDSPSEGSSEGSSQSDEPSFCGIAACTRLCDGMPPPKSRAEKRAFKRRRSKQGCVVVDLLQAPRRDKSQATPIPTFQDLMRGNKELNTGTFGVTALSGPV